MSMSADVRTISVTIGRAVRASAVLLILTLAAHSAAARAETGCRTEHVILITLDGLRWQEVFGGIDPAIYRDPAVIRHRKTFAGNCMEIDLAAAA